MKMKKITGRKLRYGGISIVITALIIALVVLVNVLLTALTQKGHLLIDMTPETLYTLSDEFITLIEDGDSKFEKSTAAPIAMIDKIREEKGDDELKLNIIFCDEKDKIYAEETLRYVQQTAEQIAKEFDGYVNIEYIDVIRNPSAVSKFKVTSNINIPPSSVIVEFGDQYRVLGARKFYTFAESDTSTPIGYNGEKEFAAAILAVTRSAAPIACITNNHGENTESMTSFVSTLEDAGYTVQTINLETEEIPKDCKLVVVYGPQKDFMTSKMGTSDVDEIEKLEDFMHAGNSLMVFMDPEAPELTDFEEFIAEWGIEFNRHETTGDAQYVVDKNYALNASGQTFKAQYAAGGDGRDILGSMADAAVQQPIVFKNAMSLSFSSEFQEGHYEPEDKPAFDYAYNTPYEAFNIFLSSSNATHVSNNEIIKNDGNKQFGLMQMSSYTVRVQEDSTTGVSSAITSYLVACGSTEFASNELLQTNSYGNTDALLMIMSNIGLEIVPVGLKYKPFADTTIDTMGEKDATVYTIVLALTPVIIAFAAGTVVLVRRKNR